MTNTNAPRSAAYIAAEAAFAADTTTKLIDAYEAWIAASYEDDADAYAKADAAYAAAKKNFKN
jgi:hypothetical protein